MTSFKSWLLKLEIGQVPEPGCPECIPVTAVPTYGADDLPPTPATNLIKRRMISKGKRMKKQ